MNPRYWLIIPAAGVGNRMQADCPKQYLKIDGRTILERTIEAFNTKNNFAGIVIVKSKDDPYWPKQNFQSRYPIHEADGGTERCLSVFNGLQYLKDRASENDWVLVHDAARPCIHQDDIAKLITSMNSHSVGGLLGLPVADTLKFCDQNGRVNRTVNRKGLWRALTPQMFRYEKLYDAMNNGIGNPGVITDEASAMEIAGYQPVMVEGRWDNIKITHPQDLKQAQLILHSRDS